ncbi:hypothetical protein PLEOSDRAFT_1089722 [Pleurotus ostreatus PC15]|uniref:Uncharacterized protein n=1 Tax=Pleurotus ostreatus (strain PC15) TaxID=1137138 RepID=A0A067NH37_PLEO1|nr:hypothetical protein PLEOSDRAFT_1089722 [Pleurotus ostreatus PC15]
MISTRSQYWIPTAAKVVGVVGRKRDGMLGRAVPRHTTPSRQNTSKCYINHRRTPPFLQQTFSHSPVALSSATNHNARRPLRPRFRRCVRPRQPQWRQEEVQEAQGCCCCCSCCSR